MPVDDPAILTRALKAASNLRLAVSLHEEDRALVKDGAVNEGEVSRRLGLPGVSTASEAVRVHRDLALARDAGAKAHIAHVSTAESLELIRAARAQDSHITCEVTPHHFMLDDSAVLRWGPNAKMAPPLRDRRHVDALRNALADGTIDMIATDHAPHDPSSKQVAMLAGCFDPSREAATLGHEHADAFVRAANGVVGLETALGLAMTLVHQQLISPSRLVELMSLNPSRLLRLDHGRLAPGATADITVVDPNLDWTVDPARFLSKGRNTPFAGMKLRGKAILTLVGGTVVYDGRRGNP
jgi:dihydroorotase